MAVTEGEWALGVALAEPEYAIAIADKLTVDAARVVARAR
jgi:2-hydroxychromene-2-carboxylate isomerase